MVRGCHSKNFVPSFVLSSPCANHGVSEFVLYVIMDCLYQVSTLVWNRISPNAKPGMDLPLPFCSMYGLLSSEDHMVTFHYLVPFTAHLPDILACNFLQFPRIFIHVFVKDTTQQKLDTATCMSSWIAYTR